MKLTLNQFYQHDKCYPVYLISGDDIFLRQQACDHVRQLVQQQGFTERQILDVTGRFDWQQLAQAADNFSLFSEKTCIELRLNQAKLGIPGSKAIKTYLQSMPDDKLLVISCPKLDRATSKSQWLTAIVQQGVWLPIWPLNNNELRHWLRQQLAAHQLTLDNNALDLLLAQTEGNLLACTQEVEKLSLLFDSGHLSIDDVQQVIADQAHYSVFDIIDAWLSADTVRIVTILKRLREEGTAITIILWALAREVQQLLTIASSSNQQQAIQQLRLWPQRVPLLTQHLQRHSLASYQQLLRQIAKLERIIKGLQVGNAWQYMERLLLEQDTVVAR